MIKLPTVSLAAIGYEKFSWKNITELLKTGMLIIGIYYCRKIYKKLDDLQKKIDKGEQDKYDLQKKFEYSLDKIKATIDKGEQDKYKIKQEKDNIAQGKDNIALEKELNKEIEQLKKEIERKKAQFKSAWREIPLYADWRKEEFQTVIGPSSYHYAYDS
ncbi:hypothetical protein R6Z07F_016763 [Ovis aries]